MGRGEMSLSLPVRVVCVFSRLRLCPLSLCRVLTVSFVSSCGCDEGKEKLLVFLVAFCSLRGDAGRERPEGPGTPPPVA